jgi:hypothetical protein
VLAQVCASVQRAVDGHHAEAHPQSDFLEDWRLAMQIRRPLLMCF